MGQYTQVGRAIAIQTPLGPDALLLEKLTGHEAISQLFHFQLDLLAEGPVDFNQVLGQRAAVTIALPNGSGRRIHGILQRLSRSGRVAAANGQTSFLRYQAELVPELWLLTRRTQSRIFQRLAVSDILKQVLHGDWGLDVSWKLTGQYFPRNYCVQYQESDFAFISRLMEMEGIAYYFEHVENAARLVLSDAPTGHADLPQFANLAYAEVEDGQRTEPRIRHWRKSQQVVVGKETVWDHHFQLPDSDLKASATIAPQVKVGESTHRLSGNDKLETLACPDSFVASFDGINKDGGEQAEALKQIFQANQRVVHLRAEEAAAQALTIQGSGDAGQLVPGYCFTLEKHFEDNGKYLLTRVEHRASLEGVYTTQADARPAYENHFECLPAALPYRPRRSTPRPRAEGPQTAVVVGPTGKETFLDKYGRVKVRFRWDSGNAAPGDSSCWVRVAQFWAGKGWGAFFWPRVGHEVVVAFEHGDPDRPLIVGSVYNNDNLPPYELPDYAVLSGIRSCSASSGAQADTDANYLLFDDEPGSEHVCTHSQTSQFSASEQDWCQVTGGAHVRIVGGAFTSGGSGAGAGPADVSFGSGSGAGLDPTRLIHKIEKGLGFSGTQSSYTFGFHNEGVIGWDRQFRVGPYTNVVYDPLAGLLGSVPLVGGLAAMAGRAFVSIGSRSDLDYGPILRIGRGTVTEGSYPMTAAAAAFSGLFGAVVVLEQLLSDTAIKWGSLSSSTASYLSYSLSTATLALWTLVESLLCQANAAVAKGQELSGILASIFMQPFIVMPNSLSVASDKVQELGNYLAKVGTAYEVQAQGPYTINAQQFSLNTQASTNVTAQRLQLSVGTGNEPNLLSLDGPNKETYLWGQTTTIMADKSIQLLYGKEPMAGGTGGTCQIALSELKFDPSIMLNGTGGQATITLQANALAKLVISQTGITASWGRNSITINQQGITIAGLTVAINATTKYSLTTLDSETQISGQKTESASMNQMN